MKLYTVAEVAKILRTNVSFVYKLIHSNQLPAMKLGQYKIRPEALEKFLIERENSALAGPSDSCNINTLMV